MTIEKLKADVKKAQIAKGVWLSIIAELYLMRRAK